MTVSGAYLRWIGIGIVLVMFYASSSIGGCVAQEESDDRPCIVLTKPGEQYTLELVGRKSSDGHNVTFSFDWNRDTEERLEVQSPYEVIYDPWGAGSYIISKDSTLAVIEHKGQETVFLGDERARLEVYSEDYFVRLVNIQVEYSELTSEIPESFRLVLALCSLLPFFLLIPDAVKNLQTQLDADAGVGVYGRIISLFLPLLTIAVTFLLLEGLVLFG